MSYAFISYSHKDSAYAHKLAEQMKAHGIEIWIDDRIDYGDQWPRVIQENLEACGAVIIIMTTTAFNSNWVQNELAFAQSKCKAIFPLLLEGTLWVSLAATQHVDVRGGGLPPEAYFEKVKKQLGAQGQKSRQRADIPQDSSFVRQSLINRIVNTLMERIKARNFGKCQIGLFQIDFYESAKNPLQPSIKEYMLDSSLTNLELLLRHDPSTYWEYQNNYEQAELEDQKTWIEMLGKEIFKTNRSLYPTRVPYGSSVTRGQKPIKKPTPHETASGNLRKRLNLFLYKTSDRVFVEPEVRAFVSQLIGIHESHHIPLSEIKVKNIK